MNTIVHRLTNQLLLVVLLSIASGARVMAAPPKVIDQYEVAFKSEAIMGEAPIWHPLRQTLFWLDVHGKRLFEYQPDQKHCRTWDFPRKISTVVPESQNTVVLAQENQLVRLDVASGVRETLAVIDDAGGKLRFNDGKCDPLGKFWVGTLRAKDSPVMGALYAFAPDGQKATKLESVQNSNGLGWSPDRKWFYHIDSPTKRVARYRYDADSGAITYDGVAVQTAAYGIPDGLAVDVAGNIWVAITDKGVHCWNPHTGELVSRIVLPSCHITACGFGGANLDELYITTARFRVSTNSLNEFPLTGSLFKVKPGVPGVRPNLFGTIMQRPGN